MTAPVITRSPIQRRPPARPRRRIWPYLLTVVLLAVLAGGGAYLLWFSSVFGVKSVVVTGADGELQGAVIQALDVPDGTPLIKVDLAAATARVRALPAVADAQVVRKWPVALEVQVTPRSPVAVTSANGTYWLLDSSGVPYQRITTPPAGLVQIELATPSSKDPATRAALVVVGALTAEFRREVAKVRAGSEFDVTLVLRDGRTVIWGGPDNGVRKMQVLPSVLAQPGTVYDISDPTLVTVR